MAKEDPGLDFGHSLTDLMSSIAVIFLLISVIFIIKSAHAELENLKKLKELETTKLASEALAKTNKARIEALEANQESATVEISRLLEDILNGNHDFLDEAAPVVGDPFLAVIRIRSSRFQFASGDCMVPDSQRTSIGYSMLKLLESLYVGAKSKGLYIEQIILEGHTDHNAFLPSQSRCGVVKPERWANCSLSDLSPKCEQWGFENNIRLSAARAQDIFFATQARMPISDPLLEWFEEKFVISGRGPVSPLKESRFWRLLPKSSSNDFALNRRVEAKVRFCNPSKELTQQNTCRRQL
jgi:flagellar motor protein MotB